MKIVFSDKKSGKTAQLEVPKDIEGTLLGKKIGDVVDGFAVGLEGFKLQITGLSDTSGTPSRMNVEGTRKAALLLSGGAGIRHAKHGFRARKLVRGNQITNDTQQINTFITEYGAKPLTELFVPKPKKTE
ncbi:MAG: 30S ribosomal protein S6e [Candidatus Micrarchaeota archaeon]|nr:30S ribosomal protein S6e [Candidatus Micrarchaeota archaeon]